MKKVRSQSIKNTRHHKPLHRRYAQRIGNDDINIVKTNGRLKNSEVKETEGLRIATQGLDQPSRNY